MIFFAAADLGGFDQFIDFTETVITGIIQIRKLVSLTGFKIGSISMERRQASNGSAAAFIWVVLLLVLPLRLSGLALTVHEVECVYEFVHFEGDLVSGNFVVVDHNIFWGSDHQGIDLIVSTLYAASIH
ncbi:hypothetical protein KFK09_016124 [Dendrobium nobile]|uniref:Uncharacterized protein n=1 Tax=Dendrobium nobile TaxID=94219 RepID=A0A8T3AYM2_DENNO|nr:hypothetical protein KFK09_016124 [Dendrobium nobile]